MLVHCFKTIIIRTIRSTLHLTQGKISESSRPILQRKHHIIGHPNPVGRSRNAHTEKYRPRGDYSPTRKGLYKTRHQLEQQRGITSQAERESTQTLCRTQMHSWGEEKKNMACHFSDITAKLACFIDF